MMKEIIKNLIGTLIGIAIGLLITLNLWGDNWYQVAISMIIGVISGLAVANIERIPQIFYRVKFIFIAKDPSQKEGTSLFRRMQQKLTMEQKINVSLIITTLVFTVSFIFILFFTSIMPEPEFTKNSNVSFVFILFMLEIILMLVFVCYLMNGWKSNLKYLPKFLFHQLWFKKKYTYYSFSPLKYMIILKEENESRKISVIGIVWRVIITISIGFIFYLLKHSINGLIKTFLVCLFILFLPLFIFREVAHSSYYLLTAASIVAGIFTGTQYANLWLGLSSGVSFFLMSFAIERIIKVNLFEYFTENMYNKFKLTT